MSEAITYEKFHEVLVERDQCRNYLSGSRELAEGRAKRIAALESDLATERQTSTRLGEALDASEQLVADLETALREIRYALADWPTSRKQGAVLGIVRDALGETDG